MTAKKLLVADDSVTIQKVIRLALSNEGYEIQAVSDGNDAVQQISVFRPDIVLVDVSLPGKNAFELKRAVNQHADLRGVRFVLMSSAFERVDEAQAAEVEFHARLTKPFDPAHLREILTQVVAVQQQQELTPPPVMEERPVPTFAAPSPQQPVRAQEPLWTQEPLQPQAPPPKPAPPPSTPTYAPPFAMEGMDLPNDPDPMDFGLDRNNRNTADDDIRQLTESTIRISGLDHFQSSGRDEPLPFAAPIPPQTEPAVSASTELRNSLLYHEGLAMRESAPPAPSYSPPVYENNGPELTESYAPTADTPRDDLGWSVQEPVLKPPRTVRREGLDISFPMEEMTKEPSSYRTPSAPPPFPPPGYNPPHDYAAPPAEAAAISELEIERLVAEKVTEKLEDALRKLTQAVLPDVVERIVKEEIHRLLSEQP